jgi:hypothetical protein
VTIHSFSQSNDGAVFFERDFVHECFHNVKSSPMAQKPPFRRPRIRRIAIEAFTFVLDGNHNFPIQAATASDVNLLLRIFVIAVNDSV